MIIIIIMEYIDKYFNNVKFFIIHSNELIFVQKWLCLKSLNFDMSNRKKHDMYDEYYIKDKPIKIVSINNKYYIVDGHHRFINGLIEGYKYFLVECTSHWRPCENEKPYYVNIYEERYNENNKYVEIDYYNKDEENIIKRIVENYPDKIIIKRYRKCTIDEKIDKYFNELIIDCWNI